MREFKSFVGPKERPMSDLEKIIEELGISKNKVNTIPPTSEYVLFLHIFTAL